MADDGDRAGSSGPGVDRHGNETIDPTKNVLDLVEASILRQDDLRHALRDEMKSQIAIVSERILGMDRATELLGADVHNIPVIHERLVAQQLEALKDLLQAKLLSVDQMFQERTLIFDEQFKSVAQRINGVEAIRDEKYTQMQHRLDQTVEIGVIEQRFDSIALQFLERDTRSTREAELNKIALDAAFAAQKESAAQQDLGNQKAIDKSEKATVDALAKLGELQKTTTDNLAGSVEDVKTSINDERTSRDRDLNRLEARLTAIESMRLGSAEALNTDRQKAMDSAQLRAYMVAGVSAFLAVITVVVLLYSRHV